MNNDQREGIPCPRCRDQLNTVILRNDGQRVVLECHGCLTLQVASVNSPSESGEKELWDRSFPWIIAENNSH